ncbi:hypothetical protein BR93DRAFT_936982 [Coniochaeta sp. PMI_546]|nr:hypothetical protein BR93DRAFT_936982 [Coniochaeta sp. PMI_546]
MSRNNSTSSFQGFSVFQPALGSTLQWLPALGSYELEEMIHTFLPGPASIQDKRAHISMDFYEFSRQTGETFKFYPVRTGCFTSATTASPASSSAMHDSGYGSSFNVSPIAADMSPWTPSLSASTPASTSSDSRTRSHSGPSQRSMSTSSRQQLDFSNHPGMRILTKDGRDITNSASRGCKSKEQRDHAHLMRIIKACDACRRKKIRCDPSHKKRTSSQAQPSRQESKQTKKAKIALPIHESPGQNFSFATPSSLSSTPSFETEVTPAGLFEGLNDTPDEFWQQFVHFDNQGIPFPGGDDFTLVPAGYVPSGNRSLSASPSQSFLPSTPGLSGNYGVLPDPASQEPALPYLNPGDSYGTNYQDFSLYSPSPTFEPLDEEPQFVRKPRRKGHTSKQDNLLVSSFQQTTEEPLIISDDAYLCDGQNHQHGDLFQTSVSDWSHVNVDGSHSQNSFYSVNDMHGIVPTTIAPAEDGLAIIGGPHRPQPSHSLGTDRGPSRPSAGEIVPVQPFEADVQTREVAPPKSYPTVSARSVLRDSTSAFVDERPYASRVVDISYSLPSVTEVRGVRAVTSSTGLPQAGVSHGALRVGEQPPAVQPDVVNRGIFAPALQQAAAVSLRRGLFARSAFILEPKDYVDVVTQDVVPSSFLSSSTWHEPHTNEGMNGRSVRAGLLEASPARYSLLGALRMNAT